MRSLTRTFACQGRLRGRFTQPLLARAGDWPRWSGMLYADLPHADVDTLQRYVSLPFELKAGRGALRAWLDVERGDWRGGAVDLGLDAVQLRLDRTLEPLSLSRLEGRLQVQRQRDGVRISAQGLGFVTEDGQRWPASQFTLGWRQAQVIGAAGGPSAPEAPVTGGEFRADRLDLARRPLRRIHASHGRAALESAGQSKSGIAPAQPDLLRAAHAVGSHVADD